MKLSEWLTGGQQVAAARRKVRELLAKRARRGGLKPADELRLLGAQLVARRHVTRLLLAGAVGTIGAGALLFDHKLPAPPRPALAPAVPPRKRTVEFTTPDRDREVFGADLEARIQNVIERVERGFARFETVLRPRIQRVPEAWLRTQMELPFRYIAGNRTNALRNLETRRRLNPTFQDLQTLPDETHFFYRLQPSDAALVASFAPAGRFLSLGEDIDPDNDLDMLIVFHEACHIVQDSIERSRLRTDADWRRYFQFNRKLTTESRPPYLDLLDEATAHALEVEALNLLLDGALESAIRDQRTLNGDAVLHRLHARPDQREKLNVTDVFAQRFYPQRWTADHLPAQSLQDDVANEYAALGYEVYLPTSQGMRLVRAPATQR
jgi:hypothetical protein